LGYTGKARFFAAYWLPGGDEACWDDGYQSVAGANWQAYLLFFQHRSVAPFLRQYEFGASDAEARHWLIFDKQERQAYVAPVRAARAFLTQQWGQQNSEALQLTPAEWDGVLAEALRRAAEQEAQWRAHPEEMEAAIQQKRAEDARLYAELAQALDAALADLMNRPEVRAALLENERQMWATLTGGKFIPPTLSEN
jgi:hypothetical protein